MTAAELAAFREGLLRQALQDYCGRTMSYSDHEALKNVTIEKEPKGKPYFADLPSNNGMKPASIHFSVSHSGDWWGCLMADEPVGFDLEVCREKVSYERIARRFFTEEEHNWILSSGRESFFEVWVRKEAYVKFLGTGLGEGLSSFTVIGNGEFLGRACPDKCGGRPGFILPCSVADGVKAAYCCESGDPIEETIAMKI
jgi:4'-phosphopantetheinyl transferase